MGEPSRRLPGDYPRPLAGFRCWNTGEGKLYSPRFGTEWPARSPFEARCGVETWNAKGLVPKSRQHLAECWCGAHAFYSLEECLRQAVSDYAVLETAIGAVLGYGGTALCHDGFRAGFGTPVALLDPRAGTEWLLRNGYGRDVRAGSHRMFAPAETLAAAASRYELPVLDMEGVTALASSRGEILVPLKRGFMRGALDAAFHGWEAVRHPGRLR